MPLIARWRGRIAPGIVDDLVDSTDFLPTILEAAQRPLPESSSIDGRSFFPRLLNEPGNPRQWIYCHFDPRPGWDKDRYSLIRFARDKRFKLYGDGRLIDLHFDRLEQHPLSDDLPPEATLAKEKLGQVLADVLQ